MYEYGKGITVPEKNPSNQSCGSIIKSVTVKEYFDEAGRLLSRETTTEYEKPVAAPAYLFTTTTINYDAMNTDIQKAVKKALESSRREVSEGDVIGKSGTGKSSGPHVGFELNRTKNTQG